MMEDTCMLYTYGIKIKIVICNIILFIILRGLALNYIRRKLNIFKSFIELTNDLFNNLFVIFFFLIFYIVFFM